MTCSTLDPSEPRVNILLVDDQPANLLALEAVLADLGQNLIKASSGARALRYLLDNDCAVILLDVQMHGLDGFETARLIRGRDRSRHMPIIFLTAHESKDFPPSKAYTLGAVDYLVKPVPAVILRAKVAGFVELFQKTEQIKRQAEQLRQLERQEFERQLAAEALRQSEERFRLLADHAPMLLWVAGRDDGCDFFNKPWLEFRGRTLAEERGRGWEEGIHPDDRTGLRQAYHEAFTKQQAFRIEYRLRRADGAYRWVLNTGVPRYHPDGSFAGYIGSAIDLTERRHAEEELRSANRAKDEFLCMLAHELRNPLAPLCTSLQILRLDHVNDPARQQALDMMGRQLRHLNRLVDDLLDVSRLVRGKVRLQREHLDLAHLVRTTVEDRRPLLDQAGLALSLDVPSTPVWIQGDPMRLAQVLTNLLDNAVKFTDPGGRVHLRLMTGREQDRAVLTVADTGIGIELDLLPRLFQTFAQADRSLARTRGGLGLGLSVVKSLIELHGGEVRAHSPGPGQGAEFTILLPLLPVPGAREPAALTSLPHQSRPAGQSLRILVVEDNRDAAESLRMLLEMGRHEVAVAYTGTDGVEAARRFHPQVVLCDLGLPGLSGYEVARTLRREPATARVRMICVSGYGQEQDRRRAREAGFDAHVVKPVDPEVLQQLLVSA